MMNTLFPLLEGGLTPWHAANFLAQRLLAAGFTELREAEAWDLEAGRGYLVRRGGSALAAFVPGTEPAAGWTMAAAHTDSPGFRLKLATQRTQAQAVVRIGTEVYGAPIHSTWLDRPLAVAGRIFVKGPQGPREILVSTEPVGTMPNLAIHYNKEVNKGFAYDQSEHLCLLAALGPTSDLAAFFGPRYGFAPGDWLSADLFAVVPNPPVLLGPAGLFQSPRIDNLAGCHAAVEGLLASAPASPERGRMALCFDQEEVGSATWTGADSSWAADLTARIHAVRAGRPEDLYRSRSSSFLMSIDATHAVHPNWPAAHDEGLAPVFGGGPALKASARFSYATTAATEARVREAAARAGLPLQTYIMKSTLSPGGTVGPMISSATGIPGVDLGIPIWAMHSAVETADLRDQEALVRLTAALFSA